MDRSGTAREMRDRAMRVIERSRFPHARADRETVQGYLSALIDTFEVDDYRFTEHLLRTGSPGHRDLFRKALAGHQLMDEEKRALSLGAGVNGGYLVPFTLDPTIIPTSSGVINPLRAISRQETTLTDKWQGVGSEGITAHYGSEAEEASDDSPKLGRLEVDTEKADAWIPFSYEIDQDWGGKEPQLAALLQRAKDELEAEKFPFGSGEDEPLGLVTAATKVIETISAGELTAADLDALEEALPGGFIENATYLGHRNVFKLVKRLDTEGGGPIWVKVPGSLPEINGIPARELSTMPAKVEEEAKVLVLGDFSHFLIVDRIGMRLHPVEQTFGPNGRPKGEAGFYAMWRNGTELITQDAFRVLEVKAA